ncbi:hypothetical protein VCRA2113O324_10129 [Vibrio crassostreae]|nr:hypothetical protein VCRA2110O182_10163 [Vibrio crassostreae]CAK1853668.1 hypothetical protein VCRA2113O324_10129 [Vibrio crassostreae]CAK1990487.1 hypothetical protein VCRA2111O320_20130 [Vibrio crassostreae]CAK2300597.1 hypothetical protein VCRA2111O408_10709 [Vibrio crassostreae]CAK2301427.1 hypothetical protein VCRA211O406_10163 [Vibrio crassostreae]
MSHSALLCQPRKASKGCKPKSKVKNKKCSTVFITVLAMPFVIFNLENPLNSPFPYPIVQKQKAPVIGTGETGWDEFGACPKPNSPQASPKTHALR